MNKEDVLMIKWLESKIEDCDNLSGMEREKWAFQQCLKNARKLFDKTDVFLCDTCKQYPCAPVQMESVLFKEKHCNGYEPIK